MTLDCCIPEKQTFFSAEEIIDLQKKTIPHHVAIIMDGNRRWGVKNFFSNNPSSYEEGHWAGAKVLIEVVDAAQEIGIKVLTVFGFSTENWTRSQKEVELLFKICEVFLQENTPKMVEQGVRFTVIGDYCRFPDSLKSAISLSKEATKGGNKIDFVIALNYGGRDELKRAIIRIAEDCMRKELSPEQITEEVISDYLDTFLWQDPDLLIRTSGEHRISNFMLWQLAYSEIYVTDVLWPDFKPKDLLKAVRNFQERQRRLGR